MVVSTDDLAALAGEIAKFAPFNYNTLHPVLEIAAGLGHGFRRVAGHSQRPVPNPVLHGIGGLVAGSAGRGRSLCPYCQTAPSV